MPRGFFTQSVAVLLARLPSMDEVLAALGSFDVRGHRTERPPTTWLGGFPEAIVGYRPERNGLVTVEIVDRRWPDAMGDPRSDPELFGAWSLGAFGPCAFPGNLARAARRSSPERSSAQRAAEEHRALLRLRSSWVLGAGEGAPWRPREESPRGELAFLTDLARALSDLDEAMAFFNPGGEVLLEPDRLDQRLQRAKTLGQPAVDTFVNVRMTNIGDAPGWALMDTIGMAQLELPDHELVFRPDRLDPVAVADCLMDLARSTLQRGEPNATAPSVDGPEGPWRCCGITEQPRMPAPRRTLRWLPEGEEPPEWLR